MNHTNDHPQEPHYDPSESQQDDGEVEQFEDEPQEQAHAHHDGNNYDEQQPDHHQPQANEGQYDDLRYDNNNDDTFQDDDPYAQQDQPYGDRDEEQDAYHPNDDAAVHADDNPGSSNNSNQVSEQAQAPAEEPRRHKYSTANMQETGKWKKICKILLLFLLFLAFMIALSALFNHFFFSGKSDNGPQTAPRPENTTFSKDKQEVDTACGRQTFAADQGTLCKEACAPQYFDCCDPFDEHALYNYTVVADAGNATDANSTRLSQSKITKEKNTTFLDGLAPADNQTCSFDQDLRGCMSYAKCQALGGQTDPAPANLPDLCSFARLDKDPGGCQDLCRKLDCCFSSKADNCLAEKFDLCMDYAPCQNLRQLAHPTGVLATAPRTLDYDCYWQQPACADTCAAAACCADPAAATSCLSFNFMACLTYAPCTDVTDVTIAVAPQFSYVNKPPNEIVYACNARKEAVLEPTAKSCEGFCAEAACCWDSNPDNNCFLLDPLGCLAWDAQCQVLAS